MIGGFFVGLFFGFVLILLGIEFYYYILARYIEKDLTGIEAIILISCLIISFAICIFPFLHNSGIFLSVFSLIPMPLADSIIRTVVFSKEKIQQRISEEKELNNWLYTIENQPENVNAYVAAGDIYFRRNEFEKALEFYLNAQKVMDMPYIMEKIKITEKEIKIKKGIVWVCPECSFDNPANASKCKICGYSKLDRDLIKDVRHHRREIFKAFLFIGLAPLGVILFIVLYIIMPPYLALVFTILVIYLTIRFFCTY